jgi:hypothetical protein
LVNRSAIRYGDRFGFSNEKRLSRFEALAEDLALRQIYYCFSQPKAENQSEKTTM